jgi:hypothetical protein
MSDNLNLYEVLKNGYDYARKPENLQNYASQRGFMLDGQLSNKHHQILYNKAQDKLIHNVVGTQDNKDWYNNIKIGIALGKHTDRYKEEKRTHEEAIKKYKPIDTTVVGHSQGGYHAGELAKDFKGLKAITYNKATPIVGKSEPDSKHETHYKTLFDPVSIKKIPYLERSTKYIYSNPLRGLLYEHSLEPLKNNSIHVN